MSSCTRGRALTSHYQCGDLYMFDPTTLDQLGRETWNGKFPADWGISAHQKVDRAHRRDARVQLLDDRAVHALRRRRCVARVGPLDRRPAARPAASARHGIHRALRDPQRLPAVLGCRPPRPGRARAEVAARPADTIRDRAPARSDLRHSLVRSGPDLRPALGERVRGRRRDRARRLLPGRAGTRRGR